MAGRIRFLVPTRHDESYIQIYSTDFICDASGEKVAFLISVPRTGNLTRFEFYLAAVANTPDNGIRCSFQDPDGSGLPDGGVDQFATIASGSVAVGWSNPGDFNSPRAVTAGQLLFCVIDNPSFTASDSFAPGYFVASSDGGVPYTILPSGGRSRNRFPYIALRYDDGTYEAAAPEVYPVNAVAAVTMQSDTTPDEFGQSFIVQAPYTMLGFQAHLIPQASSSGSTHTYTLYDASGNVITSLTVDSDISAAPSGIEYQAHYWPTPVVLRPGHRYRWSVKPDSSTINLLMYYTGYASQALMDAVEGDGWYACQRTDGGSWTDYNSGTFRRAEVSFLFEDTPGGRAVSKI